MFGGLKLSSSKAFSLCECHDRAIALQQTYAIYAKPVKWFILPTKPLVSSWLPARYFTLRFIGMSHPTTYLYDFQTKRALMTT